MTAPLPEHSCGCARDAFPVRIDPACGACTEGSERILDALRVDTRTLAPEDPTDCFLCGLTIVRTARLDGVEIEVRAGIPMIRSAWAGVLKCEHGTIFFHRPTRAWVERQNAQAGS